MHARTLAAAAITAALVLLPTAAHAGSDSPTPYVVTAAGLTLPTGTTFEEQGHINYRVTALDGTGERSFNVHQAVPHNNVWPAAAYVGQSYYAWTDHPSFAAAFPDGYCVTWVQVSLFDEPFGEGGQPPACTDPGSPVDPTDPVDPTEPTDPAVPLGPTDPTGPVIPTDPTDPAVPTEPTDPPVTVDPGEPTDTVLPVDPTEPVSEVLAADGTFQSEVLAGQLASTGGSAGPLVVAGLAALVGGTALLVMVGRRDDDETES